MQKAALYGIDYIFSEIQSIAKRESENQLFRIYITESLKNMSENTAVLSRGKFINKSYSELIQKPVNKPERTSEDIISSIKRNLKEMR